MKTVATIKIKLPFNQILLDTMEQYSKSAQIVVDAGFDQEISNKRILHDTTYRTIRDLFDLPAQLVCSSRDKACEALKAVLEIRGNKPAFKQFLAIRYDARSFSLKEGRVSLCSINSRIKISINIAEYYKQYLDWDVNSADLIYDCKHRMFLHVVVSRDVDVGSVFCGNRKTVGVDVGVNPTAITSEKQFFHNKTFKTMTHYDHLRQILQKKGTKSAKRHLKKLSGREQRFKKDINHIISKEIVERLNPGDVIVMEDLTGIRKGKWGKRWKWLGRWSFKQLQDFIKYKAERKRCMALFVEPAYTSTMCSKCGSMDTKRVRGWFHCNDCGYSLNSHLNASFNIRSLGMPIATIGSSQPAYCSL